MKIGIVTFHRTGNYGAVLQTYALQKFLEKRGHDVYIIDYIPKALQYTWKQIFFTRDLVSVPKRFGDWIKYKELSAFVKKHIKLTRPYYSNEELKADCPDFDLYISGSDQIWNPYFTLHGEEGKVTLTYFLDFVAEKGKKISYATSFGVIKNDTLYINTIQPYLKKYKAISCRENEAKSFLDKMGIKSQVVIDPTLLLQKGDYNSIINANCKKVILGYILHEGQSSAEKIWRLIKKTYKTKAIRANHLTLNDWLGYISKAQYVITNSYHGMIFAILFHRRFIIIPVEGKNSGMNDRVYTLLNTLNLENRIVRTVQEAEHIIDQEIDWNRADKNLLFLREKSNLFLEKIGV